MNSVDVQREQDGYTDRLYKWLRVHGNSIWIRELRQSDRLGLRPWLRMGISFVLTMLMALVGAISSSMRDPGHAGYMLFQVFFAAAGFVVFLMGTVVSSNSISSEKEGNTWEAIVLSGQNPNDILKGKFTASLTQLSLDICSLAPASMIPIVFGGVQFLEVVIGLFGLYLLAVLSIAFGLAFSSIMKSARFSSVIMIVLSGFISFSVFPMIGVLSSEFVRSSASGLTPSGTRDLYFVWWPRALLSFDFSISYVFLLLFVPAILTYLLLSLFYAFALSNLVEETGDRSTPLKRWSLQSSVMLSVIVVTLCMLYKNTESLMISVVLASCHTLFLCFLLAGEVRFASRRVRYEQEREGASSFKKWLGPNLKQSTQLYLGAALLPTLLLLLCGFYVVSVEMPVASPHAALSYFETEAGRQVKFALSVLTLLIHSGCYLSFIGYLKARGQTAWIARLFALLLLAVFSIIPWIFAALVAAASESLAHFPSELGFLSPFFPLTFWTEPDEMHLRFFSLLGLVFWFVCGVFFYVRMHSLLKYESSFSVTKVNR